MYNSKDKYLQGNYIDKQDLCYQFPNQLKREIKTDNLD